MFCPYPSIPILVIVNLKGRTSTGVTFFGYPTDIIPLDTGLRSATWITEEIVVAAPAVEQPEVKIQKKAIVESESEVETDKEEVNALMAAGLVLFLLTLIINGIANILVSRLGKTGR